MDRLPSISHDEDVRRCRDAVADFPRGTLRVYAVVERGTIRIRHVGVRGDADYAAEVRQLLWWPPTERFRAWLNKLSKRGSGPSCVELGTVSAEAAADALRRCRGLINEELLCKHRGRMNTTQHRGGPTDGGGSRWTWWRSRSAVGT